MTVIAFAAVAPTQLQRPSDLYIALAIIVMVAPTAMIYVYGDLSQETLILTLLGVTVIIIARNLPLQVIEFRQVVPKLALYLLIILAILGSISSVVEMGMQDFDLSFDNVYDRRALETGAMSGVSAFLQSIGRNASLCIVLISIMMPGYLIYSLIGLLFAIIDFGFGGHKHIIWGAFAFLLIKSIIRTKRTITIVLCAFAVLYVALYLTLDIKYQWLIESIPRRMTTVPIFLNDAYINYYHDKENLFWGYSKIGLGLVEYSDSLDPPSRIGFALTGDASMSANTGFVGAGYANAGIGGVIFYAFIIGVCCKIIDAYAQRKEGIMIVTAICLPGFLLALTSGDLPSVLFSNGWGVSILLAAILQIRPQGSSVS
jgi:hypothetical protein